MLQPPHALAQRDLGWPGQVLFPSAAAGRQHGSAPGASAVKVATNALESLYSHANRIVNWSEVSSLEAGAKEPEAA